MGVPSKSHQVFLSGKDLSLNMDLESSLLIRPAMEIHEEECQTSIQEDHEPRSKQQQSVQERDQDEDKDRQEEEQQQQQQLQKIIVPVPAAPLNLKLEIPSSNKVVVEDDDSNDGVKTPTSSDHKIPAVLRCPPAPRKPKSKPTLKRKACHQRIVLDLSQELEALFPTPVVVDLGAGGKNKRVKHCPGN